MSILMFVGLDVLFGLNTPKLQVPTDFKVKKKKRKKAIKSLSGRVAKNSSSPHARVLLLVTWGVPGSVWGVLGFGACGCWGWFG